MGNHTQTLVAEASLFAPTYNFISSVWSSLISLDRTSILNIAILFAAVSTLIHYARDFLYTAARMSCIASVRINDDNLLFHYLITWVAENKLNAAFNSLEAAVPFVNTWKDEQDVAGTMNYSPIDFTNLVSYRAMVSRRPIRYKPFTGSHIFRYSNHFFLLRHIEWLSVEHGQHARPRYFVTLETFGRSLAPIKSLLEEAQSFTLSRAGNTTTVFRGEIDRDQPARWALIVSRPARSISSVILSDGKKQAILRDINEYLHPSSRMWYNDHGIPYRRGYLFSGPPGTGKSTLSSAIAGVFGMNIYTMSLLDVKLTETHLNKLFASLATRCILLLEDVDAAGLVRDDAQRATNSNISLSALLNAIDGVSSPEGRILIMTTNHAEALDSALIRPGRVDMRVEFELPERDDIRALFLSIYASSSSHDAIPENSISSDEKQSSHSLDLDALATTFADSIPSGKFSIAAIQGFLLQYKISPKEAVEMAKTWGENTSS